MATNPELDLLKSSKYLYLCDLTEPRDNSLRLVVQQAVSNPTGVAPVHPELPELEELLKDAVPIESTADCRTFELTWKHYVAYLVTEECVGSCGTYEDESFDGRLFRIYAKSHFLDHLQRDTGGHTRAIHHYKIVCLNHLIDVAAYDSPEIKLIPSGSSASALIQ